MITFLRAAFVIGRRDFIASVYSKSFLFFLLGPLIILGVSVLFGSVTSNAAREDVRVAVAIVASAEEFGPISTAHDKLRGAVGDHIFPDLVRAEPEADQDAQVRKLLASKDRKIIAVMTGSLERPRITGPIARGDALERRMGAIFEHARLSLSLKRAGVWADVQPTEIVYSGESAGVLAASRAMTARAGQLALFMLTVLLAGMLLSNMIEEKSNKVIEVLAAAVPVDGIFIGKIFAMLAVSLVGIFVWAAGGLIALAMQPHWLAALPEPAVGWPAFALLVLLYFAANYLLFGALFLGIGSQAASVREVQTLSMPVTVGQMMVFLLASVAVGQYNDAAGIAAAVFPFSSPLVMISRAAQTPEYWPHLLALAWLTLWIWLTVALGAWLFRRNVLKSGARRPWFRRRPA